MAEEKRNEKRGNRPHRGRGGNPRNTGRKDNRGRRQNTARGRGPSLPQQKRGEDTIPALAEDAIRVVPLGGVEEIGKNMTAIEYGDDIIVIDCGFQFREEEKTPGIDYILPNTKYLEDRKHKVRAVVITHGHLDHIGAIPFVLDRIGNPPIYSRSLTNIMIKKRQEEFPDKPALQLHNVEEDSVVPIGKHLKVSFFNVTHTIPDSMGVEIETPFGSVVATGDMKVNHVNGVPTEDEENEFARFKDKNVLMLMADSTNVEKTGWSTPEWTVHENIEEIIKSAESRLIIGTFASQLERIIKIIEIAERYGKKVVIDGRSMKQNIEVAKQLGILKAKQGTMIPIEEMDDYAPDKIVALVTGAQGDEFASLMRMATKSHRFFKLSQRDTVVLSSSVIPGNEKAVQKLKDNIARQGAHILHNQMLDIHASGHANREELKWMHTKVGAKFFMPLHGHHYMLRIHADVAHEVGLPRKHIIIPDNSSILEIRDKGETFVKLKATAPSNIRMVDGFAIGDIQEVVIRDRKALAQDGMFVIIASVNPKTGKLRKSPDIISRGFVYLRESQDLLQQARVIVKKSVEDATGNSRVVDFDYVKDQVTDEVAKFLFQKTNKRPIVIPVLIGV